LGQNMHQTINISTILYFSRRFLRRKLAGLLLLPFFCVLLTNLAPSAYAAPDFSDGSKPFITVLSYHHIIPGQLPQGATTKAVIPLAEFETQMKYLHDNGYYTASLEDVDDFIHNNKKLPEKTVLITFDDGYESIYVYAFPLLKSYDFKATVFIIGSKMVQEEEPFDPDILSMLSFRQIKEMSDSGLVEFGSHTFDAHEYIGSKPALLSMDKMEIEDDFTRESEVFAKNSLPSPIAIAYPYGRFNNAVVEASKKFGFKLGFNLTDGIVQQGSNPCSLNRTVVPPGTDIERFKALLKDGSSGMLAGFENSIVLQIGSETAYVKGSPSLLDSCTFIESGSTMVPLRFIAQSLGARVDWIPEERKILVNSPQKTIELWAIPADVSGDRMIPQDTCNSLRQQAIVNGNNVPLETPPVIINGRVMVPIRFLSEALGFEIKWHENLRMVEIKQP